MKVLLSLIISGALVVSGFGQTRNVLVGTNNAVVQPTNFWSADASNARTGLGLGTAATNPASAFQPSSATLSNLAAGSGASLTNIAASNIIGTLSIGRGGTGSTNASDARTALGLGTASTNPASAFQASSANLTNLAANNGGSLTNLQAASLVGVIPSSNIAAINFSNLAGTLSIASGGTSATNAADARQNLGSTTVGDAVFIATNAAAARTAIGALATNGNAAGLTNFPTVSLASNVTGTIAISNGGSGATNAGGARTNLGLGATNNVEFLSVFSGGGLGINLEGGQFYDSDPTNVIFTMNGNWYSPIQFIGPNTYISFATNNTNGAAITRTNLGLGWSALTNTTASGFQTALFGTNTNPVLVNTNGEVVSPTNFWQVAPIATLLQNSTPVVNATNAATNARLLFLFSLAPSTVGVTNTITLPTNGGTFNGDVATITHSGPTSSVTAVRQLGASTNIITLNQVDESVRFLYRNNQWTLMDNISYIEPIYFSGTNASNNIAMSRSNLGLGVGQTVNFQTVQSEVFLVVQGTNTYFQVDDAVFDVFSQPYFDHPSGISFNTNNASAANTRTNLGLGATNNVTFSNVTASGTLTSTGVVTALSNAVVGGTLTATGSVTALSNVAVTGTLTATSTVTAKTNLVVEGFVDFSTNHTNVAPATNNQIQNFLQIRIGTNAFFLPLYQ